MIEKNISNLWNNGNLLININQNEYVLFNKEKSNNKIIGFYTDSIATCSGLLISINDDYLILFTHIDEETDILKLVQERLLPEIKKIKINNICIAFTKGINGLKNEKKENNIRKIIEIIDKIFVSKKIEYNHQITTSFLKLINYSSNENLIFMNIIKNQKSRFELYSQKYKEQTQNLISLFKRSVFKDDNIIFFFPTNRMKKFAELFNFILI